MVGVVLMGYKQYLYGFVPINDSTISRAVSTMAAVANKRLKRLESKGWRYAEADAPESSESIAGHRKFGAKGKTKQQLYSEFKRLKSFLTSQTSTITGARKQAKEFKVRAEELYNFTQISEAKKQYEKELGHVDYQSEKPLTEKERKNFEQMQKVINKLKDRNDNIKTFDERGISKRDFMDDFMDGVYLYNRLIEEGAYKPTKARDESDKVFIACQKIAIARRTLGWSVEQCYSVALDAARYYTDSSNNGTDWTYEGVTTQDFFNYGNN
jgi:hypothetical protein